MTTREGLPIAHEVFDGKRTDVTTTRGMVEIMEKKYGKSGRIWVMDRGMVSENNLKYLRSTGARYLVGTPKSMLKKFESELLDQDWEEVQPGVDVKVCRSPEGTEEIFVLCRSVGRSEKENAINVRLTVAAATSCAPTGWKATPKRFGTDIFRLRKWKIPSALKSTTSA